MLTYQLRQSWKILPLSWRLLVIACLVLGIFFRFSHLERKVYQYDEAFTSLRISGFLEADAVETLSNAGVVTVADIQYFQQLNTEKQAIDTVKGLAIEEPQLTPLYFLLARWWMQGFENWGSSVVVTRTLSAVISLLAFPGIWWLCVELFESAWVAWIAIALMAVSPFHLLYAQEARPPGAWAVTTLLMSAALLRAMHRKTEKSWLVYMASLAISLYTFLFSGLVMLGQAIYVAVVNRVQRRRIAIAYLASSLLGLIIFAPWLGKILSSVQQVQDVTTWTSRGRLSLFKYGLSWLHSLSLGFVDFNLDAGSDTLWLKLADRLIQLCVLVLVVYGFYLLFRKTDIRTWLFVFTLAAIPAIALALPDVLTGGVRSITPRYVIPCYLASQLAVAHLLAHQLQVKKGWQQQIWRVITVVVISAGVVSCVAISQAPAWWNKMIGNSNPAIAAIINQSERPLVVSDAGMGDIFSLSYSLDSKVRLLLRPQCYACDVNRQFADRPLLPALPALGEPSAQPFSDIFLFNPRPTPAWMAAFQQQQLYTVTPLFEGHDRWFWKLEPKHKG